MTDKRLIFLCAYNDCGQETKIRVHVATTTGQKRSIQVTEYCEHCHRPNILNVPSTWDFSPLVLGDDDDFLGYSEGIPVLRGKRPS